MYSYQHRYHAGNFADLHKHLCLLYILQYLTKKETPFAVLDAYAGEGVYDLSAPESQKNKEYLLGIGQLSDYDSNTPSLIQDLQHINHTYQKASAHPIYPGSPALIKAYLRPQDRAIFVENHPQAYHFLKQNFGWIPGLNIHQRDALEALNAFVPFPEKRGLILIDPSYEVKNEYEQVAKAVLQAHQKFVHGIYVIWYPLLPENRHILLIQQLQTQSPTLQCEWIPDPSKQNGMYGSGILVMNPPWQMDLALQECFNTLKQHSFPNGVFTLQQQ